MNTKDKLTGRLVAAARALAGISQKDFAKAAGLPEERIATIEAKDSAWISSEGEAAALRLAFDVFGIVIIDEGDGMGAGVRLKFTRQDVKQLARLEGEGGAVRSDDAP